MLEVPSIDANGQHRSRQFDTFAAAQSFEGQTKAGRATGQAVPLAQRSALLVTLADLWGEWFPIYSATIRPSTADGYEACWTAHIDPLLGTRPLNDFLTSFPVEQLHAEMARRKVGNSTIRKSVMLVKMLLDAGVSYRLLAFNGARTYHLGRRVSAKRKRALVMIPADKVEAMRGAILQRRQGAPGLTAHDARDPPPER